jgi:hypothetical protein
MVSLEALVAKMPAKVRPETEGKWNSAYVDLANRWAQDNLVGVRLRTPLYLDGVYPARRMSNKTGITTGDGAAAKFSYAISVDQMGEWPGPFKRFGFNWMPDISGDFDDAGEIKLAKLKPWSDDHPHGDRPVILGMIDVIRIQIAAYGDDDVFIYLHLKDCSVIGR